MISKLVAGLAAALISVAALGADAPKSAVAAPPPTATKAAFTFTNKLVDGKKTWVPSAKTMPTADTVEIKLVNELDDPHGFSIVGLTEQVVVNGKETKTVTASTKGKSGAHKFTCGIHPAHVGGEVTIQ